MKGQIDLMHMTPDVAMSVGPTSSTGQTRENSTTSLELLLDDAGPTGRAAASIVCYGFLAARSRQRPLL
jgi:hypothetical protein